MTNKSQDERLEQAVKEIDEKIEKEIAKLQEKKWLQVATHVAELIQKKKYTPKLCRERFDSLMDGTALKPIELDSDVEGRAEMRRTRISTNKRLREEAAAAQEAEEQQKAAARAAKKEARAANIVVKITKAQQKKIDEEKIANMKKAAIQQRKAQKTIMAQWAAYNKVEAGWLNRKQNAERMLCNKLQGLPSSYRRSRCKHGEEETTETNLNAETNDEHEEVVIDEGLLTEDDEVDLGHNTLTGRKPAKTNKHHRSASNSNSGSDNPAPRKKATGSSSPTTRRSARLARSASPKHIAIGEAPVTDTTRASPRSCMTLAELDAVCVRRDLLRVSSQETQEQVVARLDAEDKIATSKALDDALRASGLSTGGKVKAAKIQALQEYDAEERDA